MRCMFQPLLRSLFQGYWRERERWLLENVWVGDRTDKGSLRLARCIEEAWSRVGWGVCAHTFEHDFCRNPTYFCDDLLSLRPSVGNLLPGPEKTGLTGPTYHLAHGVCATQVSYCWRAPTGVGRCFCRSRSRRSRSNCSCNRLTSNWSIHLRSFPSLIG